MKRFRVVGRIALLTLAHLVVAFAAAIAAFGWDLDQLRSRTPWSRAAAVVNDVLWFPHDTFLRAIPNPVFVEWHRVIVPGAIVLNSLLWALVIDACWRLLRRRTPWTES